jgi:hypothetical protein
MLDIFYAEKHLLNLPYKQTYLRLTDAGALGESTKAVMQMEADLAHVPRPSGLDDLLWKLNMPVMAPHGDTIFVADPQSGGLQANFNTSYNALFDVYYDEAAKAKAFYGIPSTKECGVISQDRGLYNLLVENMPLTNHQTPASQTDAFPHVLAGDGDVIIATPGGVIDPLVHIGCAPFFNHATITTGASWEGLRGGDYAGAGSRCVIHSGAWMAPIAQDGTLGTFGAPVKERCSRSMDLVAHESAEPGELKYSYTSMQLSKIPGRIDMEIALENFLCQLFQCTPQSGDKL